MSITKTAKRKQPVKQAGFTLIELVVVTAVAGILIIAIVNTFITIANIQRQSRHVAIATEAAESKLESLRNDTYNTIPVSPPAIDFTDELPDELADPKSATITVTEPRTDVKRLDATVTYWDGKKDKTIKLSTLVSKLGISQ